MAGSGSRQEGRVPPYDGNAEAAVLGSVILNNNTLTDVKSVLGKADFYVEANRRIYESMLSLDDVGVPIDVVTLASELKKNGDMEKVGGAMTLAGLGDAVATSQNVVYYAGIVYEQAAKRRVLYQAQELVAVGYSGDNEDITRKIDSLTDSAVFLSRTQMPDSLLDMGHEVLSLYQRVASGYQGVPMPWETLSSTTSGMWPKTLTIFVARPGVGKTQVAILIGRHAWSKHIPTLVVSPEMSKIEIAERFFVTEAKVSYKDVVSGTLSDMELPKLKDTVEGLKGGDGYWIMDSEDDLTPRGIERAIRACNPKLVAIDSLYKLRIRGDRKERLITALEWFGQAAKDYNFAGVGFAQQNRTAELSSKRGGGARLGTIALADEMGQDPHAVFYLSQTKDQRADKLMRIGVLKLRRGKWVVEHVDVNWDFDSMNFDEVPPSTEFTDKEGGGFPF